MCDLDGQRAWGNGVPSSGERPRGWLHRRVRNEGVEFRLAARATQAVRGSRGNPSAKTSSRRSSGWLGATMSISWMRMFVVTLRPASRHMRAATNSKATHDSQKPPPQHMLRGGDHWDRVDGHTGKRGWKRVGGARSEKLVGQALCVGRLDNT